MLNNSNTAVLFDDFVSDPEQDVTLVRTFAHGAMGRRIDLS